MNIKSVYRIIDEYNDAAFEACKNSLYDKLNFFIMAREDIRRVDLKEKLAAFFDEYKKESIESTFVKLATGILNEHISVDSNSREKKYLDKFREYSSSLQKSEMKEEKQIAILENLIMVYLSFLSKYKEIKKGKDDKEKVLLKLKDVVFKNTFDDSLETIKYVHKGITKCGTREEKKPFRKSQTYYILLKSEEQSFLYVVSTLIAFRIFQFEGEI